MPDKLGNHCKKSRSTLLNRKSMFESLSNDSEVDASIFDDLSRFEKQIYGGVTAVEAGKEFSSIFNDIVKYSNYMLYSQLKEIYMKELNISENTFGLELNSYFESISEELDQSVDQMESSIIRILDLNNYSKEIISKVSMYDNSKQAHLDGLYESKSLQTLKSELDELFKVNTSLHTELSQLQFSQIIPKYKQEALANETNIINSDNRLREMKNQIELLSQSVSEQSIDSILQANIKPTD